MRMDRKLRSMRFNGHIRWCELLGTFERPDELAPKGGVLISQRVGGRRQQIAVARKSVWSKASTVEHRDSNGA